MSDLTKHLLIHCVDRPMHCTVCDKRFAQKSNLIKHLLAKHLLISSGERGGERPLQCNVCDKRFTSKDTLSKHLGTHNYL